MGMMIMIDDIIGCDIAGLMPWRTPWEYEDNLHHDTFLEQRAAHSPTASRGNSPPNTPPLLRQGSYRQGGDRSSFRLAERRPESGPTGEGLLSPLAESLRLTTMTAEEASHDGEIGEGEGHLVLEGADGPGEASRTTSERWAGEQFDMQRLALFCSVASLPIYLCHANMPTPDL